MCHAYHFLHTAIRPRFKEDWEAIQTSAENDTDESVVHSFGGMCAFSNEVMGQETEGRPKSAQRAQKDTSM